MKKTIKALKFSIFLVFVISSFIACDKDFSVIESDVLGKGNANFSTNVDSMQPISAYNRKLNALQINGLASNLLGVFNDPAYGQTTASIITQITPTTFSPDFGVNPVIDEVILNIPYFSTVIGSDTEGNATYKLDSLYGNPDADIKLSIYRNTYFLRDFDPNSADNSPQYYYSNADSGMNSALNGTSVINFDNFAGAKIYENLAFRPSAEAIVTTTGEGDSEVSTRSLPALRVELDKLFWTNTIIDLEGDPALSNANNFKNYLRGLYFKAEAIGGSPDGSMFLLNLASSSANITINYTSGTESSRTESTYVLNFSGNRLNTFINNYDKVTFPANPNTEFGDETLYLKGAAGSMAVVDLFPNGPDDFLKAYRLTDDNGEYVFNNTTGSFVLKRLINEAHLSIYEDETIETGGVTDFHKYDRIYAYDIDNNTTTVDYLVDPTANDQNPFNSRLISLGQRLPNEDDGLSKYKIRLTEHLNNILLRDSTNTKIGLVLSTNVNYTTSAQILNSNDDVTAIPAATILTPRGTILHGSNTSVDAKKRLKLKIFYTEPN